MSNLTECATCSGKMATNAPLCVHCGAPSEQNLKYEIRSKKLELFEHIVGFIQWALFLGFLYYLYRTFL